MSLQLLNSRFEYGYILSKDSNNKSFDNGDLPRPVCKTIPVPLITRFNLKDVSKSILFLARLMVSSLTFEVIFSESIFFFLFMYY